MAEPKSPSAGSDVLLQALSHMLTENSEFGRMTVFHFESPKSSELAAGVEEAPLVEAACKLSSHGFVPFRPTSIGQVREQLRYIFKTWETAATVARKPQFVIHLSCHGNEHGIAIGGESLSWKDLGDAMSTAAGTRNIPFVLTISACGGATAPSFADAFTGVAKPIYIFSFGSKVSWSDAALTWAVIYSKISGFKVGDKLAIQALVTVVNLLAPSDLRYHRWDGGTYKKFRALTVGQSPP
jgi:hypothetical protein